MKGGWSTRVAAALPALHHTQSQHSQVNPPDEILTSFSPAISPENLDSLLALRDGRVSGLSCKVTAKDLSHSLMELDPVLLVGDRVAFNTLAGSLLLRPFLTLLLGRPSGFVEIDKGGPFLRPELSDHELTVIRVKGLHTRDQRVISMCRFT